jgi:SAM-dependent methyltransferase
MLSGPSTGVLGYYLPSLPGLKSRPCEADTVDESLYAEMFALEEKHWWFTARHAIIQSLLRRSVRASCDRPRIADLGCGCGKLLSLLAADYDIIGLDGSPLAVAFCGERGVAVQLGDLGTAMPWAGNSFDAVLLLDVLEHLDDDQQAVTAAADLLRPGGTMICTVPAYPWLWTKRDERHHHRRRYTKSQFRRLFQSLSLRCELLSHFNAWLFPLAVMQRLSRRLLRTSETATDLQIPPKPVNALLRAVFASERHVLGRLPLPFGLSLIAVVRKVGSHDAATESMRVGSPAASR